MLIGHGRVDITPKGKFYLLGYKTPTRNQPAKGIHDHIFINGILFQNQAGEQRFLATGDLLEIEDIVAADIKMHISQKYHIAVENIIIGVPMIITQFVITIVHGNMVNSHKNTMISLSRVFLMSFNNVRIR